MTIPIENILKLLEEEFERMITLFKEDDWKFYKFGQGGPYKRTLSHIQKMSKKYDKIIFARFGINKETASFNKLIVICLQTAKNSKLDYKHTNTFKRQITWMRETVKNSSN